jgi:hypothetical protein
MSFEADDDDMIPTSRPAVRFNVDAARCDCCGDISVVLAFQVLADPSSDETDMVLVTVPIQGVQPLIERLSFETADPAAIRSMEEGSVEGMGEHGWVDLVELVYPEGHDGHDDDEDEGS